MTRSFSARPRWFQPLPPPKPNLCSRRKPSGGMLFSRDETPVFLMYSFTTLTTASADIPPFTSAKYRQTNADIAVDNAPRESQYPPTTPAILPTTTPPAPPSHHRPPANVPPPRNALTTTVLTTPKTRPFEHQNLYPIHRLTHKHKRIARQRIRRELRPHQPRQGIKRLPHIRRPTP